MFFPKHIDVLSLNLVILHFLELTFCLKMMQLMLAILLTICFLIMGVNTQKLLVAFSSILLPSVFVFGNAARSTFESLIFLFIMHPFDVGDRINVDNVSLVVEVRLHLLSSFSDADTAVASVMRNQF